MAESLAQDAYGAKLYIGGVKVAELTSIPFPNQTAEDIEVSSHDSDNEFKEYVGGFRDGGDVPIEGNWIGGAAGDAGQRALLTAFDSQVTQDIEIWTSADTDSILWVWTIRGRINAFSGTGPHAGKIDFSASIKITGKPSLASSAAA